MCLVLLLLTRSQLQTQPSNCRKKLFVPFIALRRLRDKVLKKIDSLTLGKSLINRMIKLCLFHFRFPVFITDPFHVNGYGILVFLSILDKHCDCSVLNILELCTIWEGFVADQIISFSFSKTFCYELFHLLSTTNSNRSKTEWLPWHSWE